jgi:SagB-type dehydrogenase family enzyme
MTQSKRDRTFASVLPGLPSGAPAQPQPETQDAKAAYLEQANRAQALLQHGYVDRARAAFEATLAGLGGAPSYARAAISERLGRCQLMSANPAAAATTFNQGIDDTDKIPLTDGVRGLQCALRSGLGDAFRAMGRLGEARKAYEAALALSTALKDLRAQGIDLDHLGALALAEGRLGDARAHYEAALGIFQELRDRASEAIARHHMGRVLQAAQRWQPAEDQLLEAARLREELGERVGAAQSWSQLAAIAATRGHAEEAEARHRKAVAAARQADKPVLLRHVLCALAGHLLGQPQRGLEARKLLEEALTAVTAETFAADVWGAYGMLADILDRDSIAPGPAQAVLQAQARNFRHVQQFGPRLQETLAGLSAEPSYARAVLTHRLGRCFLLGNRFDLALGFFDQALAVAGKLPATDPVKSLQVLVRTELAGGLRAGSMLPEARKAYEAALATAEELKDLRAQAAALSNLAAVALEEEQPEEAVARGQGALRLFRTLHDRGSETQVLQHLGLACEGAQQWNEAERHYIEAARVCEERGDEAGAAVAKTRLAAIAVAAGDPESRAPDPVKEPAEAPAADAVDEAAEPGFKVTIHEDATIDCVFGSDLLIDIGQESRLTPWTGTPAALADGLRPMLLANARPYIAADGALRFGLPDEPSFEHQPHCVIMRKARREVEIAGDLDIVWQLIRLVDGARTVGQVLTEIAVDKRPAARQLLEILAATGVLDISGRPIARFVHAATKKGVVIGGGLEGDEVLRLVTDGNYRAFADAPHIALSEAVPDRLRSFHDLTRKRRSRRDYSGRALAREEFAVLLNTACGVTGVMPWSDRGTAREVKLRAYPSSGALYAVEIYPIVLGVEGLEPGVYHYTATDNTLEVVRTDVSRERLIATMLPVERAMVSGAAAMICLVGQFKRHEHKYGEGGYRMMVAEAGHISQTLVLAATALGLAARPFGGVFDRLLNEELGLDEAEEQFLLSVLVGHGGTSAGSGEHQGQSGETP